MPTIQSYIPKYLKWRRVSNTSAHEIKNTKYYLRVFIRFVEECNISKIEDITYEIIREYQEDLSFRLSRFGRLWTAGSQNNAIVYLKGFLKWLVREDYLVSDPSAKVEYAKQPDILPRNILDEKEINKLLKQPDTQTLLGCRDRVVLEILYSSGIRKGEIENLKLSDVDYHEGYLRVDQGKNRKDRVVPLGKIACEMLQNYIIAIRSERVAEKYRGNESEYLFINRQGGKLSHNAIGQVVKKYAKQAGIKKKITPHCLRHTCATHMLKNDAHIRHIQEMLGHSSVTTTEKYTRITINDLKKVHEECHPREKS